MAELQVQAVRQPEGLVVRVCGDAGVASVEQLQRRLRELNEPVNGLVVLDLSGLVYVCSLGIGVLVEFRNRVVRAGGRVKVASAQPMVHQVFTRTALDGVLEFCESVEQALGG